MLMIILLGIILFSIPFRRRQSGYRSQRRAAIIAGMEMAAQQKAPKKLLKKDKTLCSP